MEMSNDEIIQAHLEVIEVWENTVSPADSDWLVIVIKTEFQRKLMVQIANGIRNAGYTVNLWYGGKYAQINVKRRKNESNK
jgi:hypothetical protein